jgi:ribosome-binding protein aMBF1 (putative translation factor)
MREIVPIVTYPVNLFLVYFSHVPESRPEIVGSCVIRLLREKREALGLSMNSVAARAGLSHSMISRVEHGLRKPTLDTLLRITGAMGIEIWPFLKNAEGDTPVLKSKPTSK